MLLSMPTLPPAARLLIWTPCLLVSMWCAGWSAWLVLGHVGIVMAGIHIAGMALIAGLGQEANVQNLQGAAHIDGQGDLEPWEGRLLRMATVTAAAGGWAVTVSHCQFSGTDSHPAALFAGCVVASVAAIAATLFVADDLRHRKFDPEAAAVCVAGGVLWAWLVNGGDAAAGASAISAVLASLCVVAINGLVRALSGVAPYGSGEWLVVAAAGGWIGSSLALWTAVGVVSIVILGLMHGSAQGRRVAVAPAMVAGILVGWAVT